jgi:anti-sigma B factor antagonist
MAASASIRKIGNVSIIDLKGRIMLGDGSGVIRETIQGLVAEGERNLLLNLAEVTYIDSSGLGEMVAGYITLVTQGGSIKLLNATWMRDVLQITKLYTVFEAFTGENAAVASFEKATA